MLKRISRSEGSIREGYRPPAYQEPTTVLYRGEAMPAQVRLENGIISLAEIARRAGSRRFTSVGNQGVVLIHTDWLTSLAQDAIQARNDREPWHPEE